MATEDKIPNTLPGFSRVFILTSQFRAIVIHPSRNAVRLIDHTFDVEIPRLGVAGSIPSPGLSSAGYWTPPIVGTIFSRSFSFSRHECDRMRSPAWRFSVSEVVNGLTKNTGSSKVTDHLIVSESTF